VRCVSLTKEHRFGSSCPAKKAFLEPGDHAFEQQCGPLEVVRMQVEVRCVSLVEEHRSKEFREARSSGLTMFKRQQGSCEMSVDPTWSDVTASKPLHSCTNTIRLSQWSSKPRQCDQEMVLTTLRHISELFAADFA